LKLTALTERKKNRIRIDAQKLNTSLAKWELIEKILRAGAQIDRNSIIFIKLQHLHPRLDLPVLTDCKHLLRLPFTIHKDTGASKLILRNAIKFYQTYLL